MYHLPRKQSAAQAGPRWVFFRSCLVTWNLSKLMVTVLKMDAGLEFTFCCSIPCSGFNQWQNRKRGWLLVAVELYVRCSVSLLVYGKHSQSVANRKIAKKMIDLEICLDLNWPMTNRNYRLSIAPNLRPISATLWVAGYCPHSRLHTLLWHSNVNSQFSCKSAQLQNNSFSITIPMTAT